MLLLSNQTLLLISNSLEKLRLDAGIIGSCLISRSAHANNQFYETRIFVYLLFEYFDSKILPGKCTQKVNKQKKNRCKNSGFILVVRIS